METKVCCRCKLTKQVTSFHMAKEQEDGLARTCISCRSEQAVVYNLGLGKQTKREYKLHTKYGMKLSDYRRLFENQSGSCKLCLRHQSEFEKILQVDHCHKTNRIRGLLCHKCNKALGLFKDDVETINRVSSYLKGQ